MWISGRKESGYEMGGCMSEWISVKDRLPENKGNYLVWLNGDFYRKPYVRQYLNGYWYNQGDLLIWDSLKPHYDDWIKNAKHLKKVLYWMPLPKPPENK